MAVGGNFIRTVVDRHSSRYKGQNLDDHDPNYTAPRNAVRCVGRFRELWLVYSAAGT